MNGEEAALTESPAQEDAPPVDGPKPIKAEDVHTLMDFFRYAYQQGGRRLSLKKSVAKSMNPEEGLQPGSVEQVRTLAQRDPDLKVPHQVLAILDRPVTPPRLRTAALSLVAAGVKTHPLMASLLRQLEEGGDLDDALSSVGALSEEEVAELMGGGEWKAKRVTDLKGSAISTAALLEAVRRDIAPDDLARTLDKHVWGPSLKNRPPQSERAALAGAPNLTTNGLIAEICQREVAAAWAQTREAQQLVHAAETNRDQARQQLASELNRSAALAEQMRSLERRIADLEGELAAERERLQMTRTEGSYEYERLRARLQRRLKSDIELLNEGLHALRRDKPHVMEDRAERALEALEAELETLKGSGRT